MTATITPLDVIKALLVEQETAYQDRLDRRLAELAYTPEITPDLASWVDVDYFPFGFEVLAVDSQPTTNGIPVVCV